MEDEVNNVPLRTAFPCHLTPKQQAGLTRLLGRGCIVRCNIQEREIEALWDTGSQVCVVSRAWKQANLPFEKLRSVDELLQEGNELSLEAMNGTDIPLDGWIEVTLRLVRDDADADELLVPVLVGQQEQDYPIIGFNVIEEILKRHNEEPLVVSHTMIRRSFPSVRPSKVGMLVNPIRTRTEDAGTSVVRVGRRDVMVPRGKSLKVKCRVHHQKRLNLLVDRVTSPPVMAFTDFTKPFVLHTDASLEGLGAVLYQEQDGKVKVMGYASRTLTPAEKNYYLHSGKLEFLALKWAVTEKFRDYLYYAPFFDVYTDNNPLTYVLTSAKLSAVGHRWVAELADFDFRLRYRPGKMNTDADFLSRLPLDPQE